MSSNSFRKHLKSHLNFLPYSSHNDSTDNDHNKENIPVSPLAYAENKFDTMIQTPQSNAVSTTNCESAGVNCLSNEMFGEVIQKQAASEMLCFYRYVGLILGTTIPKNNEYW